MNTEKKLSELLDSLGDAIEWQGQGKRAERLFSELTDKLAAYDLAQAAPAVAPAVLPSDAWRAFLESLREAGHRLVLTDAQAAQLVADALDIVSPDDDPEAEAAPYFANSFSILAADIRDIGA